jgi:hypothetical protein
MRLKLSPMVLFAVVLGLVLFMATILSLTHKGPQLRDWPVLMRQGTCELTWSAAHLRTHQGRWQQDVNYLARELTCRHPSPFRIVSSAQFDRAASELERTIPNSSREETLVGLLRLVARVGDSHTFVERPQLSLHVYLIRLAWFSDGLFVTHATLQYHRALGARLIRIGETPVDEAYRAVKSLIPHENDSWARVRSCDLLNTAEILQGLHILNEDSEAPFTFVGSDGKEFKLLLRPVAEAEGRSLVSAVPESPLFEQGGNFWYRYWKDSKTVYLNYHHAYEGPPFSQFSEDLLHFLDQHPVERVIVDLRGNMGGVAPPFGLFVSGLASRQRFLQKGRLLVLIGPKTFSAGVDAADELQKKTGAVFIGEPTGGKRRYCGMVSGFVLPNSQIQITHSTVCAEGIDQDPPTLAPDVYVPTPFADYRLGRDPVVEAALKFALD